MKRIYFDNAATTPLSADVLEAMMPYLTEKFGNASSIHGYGREARLAIETARKSVASIINAQPSEVFFTSGGTESTNTAIHAAIHCLGCKHIITSPIEHHATLHTVEHLQKTGEAGLTYLKLTADGYVDLGDLEVQLKAAGSKKCLVTLMHANNEIGNLTDIEKVASLCEKYDAIFHADVVQTLAHYPLDVKKMKVHFLSGAGHKFHGPKGIGMLYINQNIKIEPLILGGSQERNMRAGTENIYGIVGFAKALEIANQDREAEGRHIKSVRDYMAERLAAEIPGVTFNGNIKGDCLYTVLSVGFSLDDKSELLLFNLDLHNICASGGSACSSGAEGGSHVIAAVKPGSNQVTVRFSFSKYNTTEEVDQVMETLKTILL